MVTTRQIALARRRAELGRLGSVADGAAHRHVVEWRSGARAPQQQTAAAHVSPSSERRRKEQPIAEHVHEWADVFLGRHAAEEDRTSVRYQGTLERHGVLHERFAVARLVFMDRDFG